MGVGHSQRFEHGGIPQSAVCGVGYLHHKGRGDPPELTRSHALMNKLGEHHHARRLMAVVDRPCPGGGFQIPVKIQAP